VLGYLVSPLPGFVTSFALTLALLALVVTTGLRAKRALHLTSVGLTLCALALTVYFAYALGDLYDLERAGWITPVHLTLARINTAALLIVAASGIATLLRPSRRLLHRKLALATVALTVITAITGFWMLWLSPRL
jgi:hypothetical protein